MAQNLFCQLEENGSNHKDYKNEKQFEKFHKRRTIIGAWQINQLKEGALVVKLKTNKTLIDELTKVGNISLATAKRVETDIINKNVMMAYKDNFNFCKVYFIYSYSNDSLLNGARFGIFLDTNLIVDSKIEMKEKFYLLAERDYLYNSSVGFVKEDSARFVSEHGNPSGQVVEIVIKNKYGHQLKKPFPYECGFGFGGAAYTLSHLKFVPVYYYDGGLGIKYNLDKTQLIDLKNNPKKEFKKAPAGAKTFKIEKQYSYEVLSSKVIEFNQNLNEYYKASPKPEMDKLDKEILQFLY